MFVCSLVGFFYGAFVFLAKKSPLYAKMITGAVACMMFASLLAVVRRLTGFETRTFQLDYLAYIGVFLFLLTANAGLMDGLGDDGSKALRKYRLIALAAPAAVAVLYLPILLSGQPTAAKVIFGVVALFVCAASYFNFKHAVLPDVDFGVIRCVREYNWLALASRPSTSRPVPPRSAAPTPPIPSRSTPRSFPIRRKCTSAARPKPHGWKTASTFRPSTSR